MANILIIDDNRASSALLKMSLNRHRYRVRRTSVFKDVINLPVGLFPDLILINQAINNHSGWAIFNRLKSIAPQMQVLVYVLDNHSAPNAAWIVKAVEAVIGETKNHAARYSKSPVKNKLFAASSPQ
jgi:response regulator RpfG family c-di-GMP phosphodiesterase